MDWRAICAAVIPCLNEEDTIATLVRAVRRHLSTVVVVDDGSTDHTGELAAHAGATVLRLERNRGKGAALRQGWRHAFQTGFQWAMTLDGDGQHSPDDIPAFLVQAERTRASLVIGNRMHAPAPMPWVRRTVNRWMSARLSKAAGQALPDSQCGFRLVKLAVLQALSVKTEHFEIESEVLLAFARARERIEFVPIRPLYKTEQSKIHPVKDTLRWRRWWREAQRAGKKS